VNSDSSEEEITEANDTSMAEHQVNALISLLLMNLTFCNTVDRKCWRYYNIACQPSDAEEDS